MSGSGEVLGRFWVGSRADLWAPSEEAGKVEIYNCFISAGSLTASPDPKQRKLLKRNDIKMSDFLELACSGTHNKRPAPISKIFCFMDCGQLSHKHNLEHIYIDQAIVKSCVGI